MAQEIRNVAGVDDPYEPPTHPDVLLHTDAERPDASVLRILQALVDAKFIGPAEFGRLTGGQRPRKPGKAGKAAKAGRGAGKARKPAAAKARRAGRRR
jgi:hypothetical protein